jgi:8-oxo-dGTP diphosphatase
VDVIEHVERDAQGRVRYHYIVVDYVCRCGTASPKAAEDAMAVAVVSPADLGSYQIASRTVEVIHRARRLEAG